MLVLTRKLGESIAIDDHIKIRVVQIKGKQVRLGIEAPKDTKIHREEVYLAIQDQNKESSQVSSDKSKSVASLLKPLSAIDSLKEDK
ncbi:MAG: carbon storage regulator CsrA [Deltaproteobacteria bacterium]|jgi:carbon storage regulator|nr:carbon storage regulator CsrA [Deltaproteobacteria bacterium]